MPCGLGLSNLKLWLFLSLKLFIRFESSLIYYFQDKTKPLRGRGGHIEEGFNYVEDKAKVVTSDWGTESLPR